MASSAPKREWRLAFDDVRVVIVVTLVAWSCGTRADGDSVYTSIRPADCRAPAKKITEPYAARDLGVQQCPAPAEWRLLLVSSDRSTWIDLAGPGITWSGERTIVYDSPVGNFPTVGGASAVEWRLDSRRRATAIIFRVTAQDTETLRTTRSMLYVVRLLRDRACLLGRVSTNAEARRLADSNKGC